MFVRFRDRCPTQLLGAVVIGLALSTLGACGSGAPTQAPGPREDSAPAIGMVRDGLDTDVDQQDQRSSLFANWDPFVDPEGYPVVYEWCIGRTAGAADVLPWSFVGGATRASTTGTELPAGFPLYVSVRATDIAGHRSAIATSNGIVLGTIDRSIAPVTIAPSTPIPVAPPSTTSAPPSLDPTAPSAAPLQETPGRYTAIERFGITWRFARPVDCGRFVNGDWWIAGPCEIVSISPASRTDDDRTRHGSMINPDPRSPQQGYDSAMFGPDSGDRFDATKNVALGISSTKRLRLEPGSSLVSTISHAQPGQLPQLETCAVLTCLPVAPPKDAFRPPYCGTDKQCRWLASKLDLTRLASLATVPGAPLPAELLPRFERTWLDHVAGWTGRFVHPRENMPDYGRDIADLVGAAGLALQLDYSTDDKRALAIAMVQVGIDLAGVVRNGGRFLADGGSGSGRKFPVLFAGAMLQDRELLALAREQKLAFAEDVQTFYVEQTAPGVWNRGFGDYGPDDQGLAEWGNQHADDPSFDRKSWTSDPYRRCCTANVWHGFVLAARIMGLREAWGHPALFDYVDRYMQIEASGEWTRSWSPFAERMWDRYRASY